MRCTSCRSIEPAEPQAKKAKPNLGGMGQRPALIDLVRSFACITFIVSSIGVRAAELEPTVIGDLDFRAYASEDEGLTGFALGRLRPGLQLAVDDWLKVSTAVEFAGEYPEVLDAYVAVSPDPTLTVTFGLAKPPLFWSHREPIESLTFADTTAVAQSLRVNRDLGIGAHWSPQGLPFELFARVGNGSASFLANDNTDLAYYLGVDLVLGRERDEPSEAGLRLGVTGLYEHAEDRNGIVARHALGFLYHRAPTVSGDRWIGEAHLLALYGPMTLLIEAGYADEARSKDDDGNPATPRRGLASYRNYGVSLELDWTFCGRRVPGEARTAKAIDLGLRLERMWLGRGATDVVAGGSSAATLVTKWWLGEYLAVSALGMVIGYDTPAIEDPARDIAWGAFVRLSLFSR